MSATVKRRRPSIASITSPLGSFGLPGSCAGPQTPSGNDGALCTSACILSMWALWSLSRVSSMCSTVRDAGESHRRETDRGARRLLDDARRAELDAPRRHGVGERDLELGVDLERLGGRAVGGAGVGRAARAGAGRQRALAGDRGQHARRVGAGLLEVLADELGPRQRAAAAAAARRRTRP